MPHGVIPRKMVNQYTKCVMLEFCEKKTVCGETLVRYGEKLHSISSTIKGVKIIDIYSSSYEKSFASISIQSNLPTNMPNRELRQKIRWILSIKSTNSQIFR